MFTLYGNQYEDREEHLLLSMFEVYRTIPPTHTIHIIQSVKISCVLLLA